MTKLNRAQRVALKRVFDRGPIEVRTPPGSCVKSTLTYLGFRKRVQPTFLMDNAVVVSWQGMWLAIEADGYVHS